MFIQHIIGLFTDPTREWEQIREHYKSGRGSPVGHILILAIVGLILVTQSWAVGFGGWIVMSAIMVLELFVATLQAYIFAMLTSVFIGLIRHAH